VWGKRTVLVAEGAIRESIGKGEKVTVFFGEGLHSRKLESTVRRGGLRAVSTKRENGGGERPPKENSLTNEKKRKKRSCEKKKKMGRKCDNPNGFHHAEGGTEAESTLSLPEGGALCWGILS